MLHLRGAILGIIIFCSLVVGAGAVVIYMGYAPMTADSAPSQIEASLAMRAVHAVSDREMGERKNPLAVTAQNMSEGLQVFRQNCIVCHGAADGKKSNIAYGFYVPSPQFASDGAEDDPEGSTFWKIHQGIRYSAMPAFMHALSDTQIWQVTMFLKHMDALPKETASAWKAVPSVGGTHPQSAPKMDMR